MKVGTRVKLLYFPEGWEDVTGHVIVDDDAEGWALEDEVLVQWSNGEQSYASPQYLIVLDGSPRGEQ